MRFRGKVTIATSAEQEIGAVCTTARCLTGQGVWA